MDCDGRLGRVVDNADAMSERGQESGKKKKGVSESPLITGNHTTRERKKDAEGKKGKRKRKRGALLYCSTVLLRRGLVDLCTTRCIPAVTCDVSR
jgi:hypothetical protein